MKLKEKGYLGAAWEAVTNPIDTAWQVVTNPLDTIGSFIGGTVKGAFGDGLKGGIGGAVVGGLIGLFVGGPGGMLAGAAIGGALGGVGGAAYGTLTGGATEVMNDMHHRQAFEDHKGRGFERALEEDVLPPMPTPSYGRGHNRGR